MKSIEKTNAVSGEPDQSSLEGQMSCQLIENSVGESAGRSFKSSVSGQALPRDLRVSWSWPHFALFLSFCLLSRSSVRFGATLLVRSLVPHSHLTPEEFRVMSASRPEIAVGINLAWYALVFLFLYATLSNLRGSSFWPSLGWRNSLPTHSFLANPWICFFSGCCLATCIAFFNARFHTSGAVTSPATENRLSALLFAGMALFVAPVVEETVFRGYLYPLLARSFGVRSGIVLTGISFGMIHGRRLDWDWFGVSLLAVVGLILTFARAKTGTVLSSFCVHLGYNSVLVFASIFATQGFTEFPPRLSGFGW
jgi:membrane protease YdiL (CAAX protease family)